MYTLESGQCTGHTGTALYVLECTHTFEHVNLASCAWNRWKHEIDEKIPNLLAQGCSPGSLETAVVDVLVRPYL